MFGFIEKLFIGLLSVYPIGSFGASLASNYKEPIKCVSLNNKPCKARKTLIKINSDKALFYPFTVSANNCSGSCNTFDDSYSWICVRNKVKNLNLKVFNLMSGVNETRFIVQHESCNFECELN